VELLKSAKKAGKKTPLRLLSPQHYSQKLQDLRGTYSVNFGNQVVFVWQRRRFKATMPLTSFTNVGILCSAPGHCVFSSFLQLCNNSPPPAHFASTLVVTNDKADALQSDANGNATLPSTLSLEGEEAGGANASSTPSHNNGTFHGRTGSAHRHSF
jgi:hypothetical protein